MVICEVPVSHGPHVWYAAVMWNCNGRFMDFLRIKECRRPAAPNLMCGRNEYHFQRTGDGSIDTP